jgi:DNA primase
MRSDDVRDRVKAAIDLVEFVGSYFPLQKRGNRFMARCPFHEEKSPSFGINAGEQYFKCFGCGKGGDVFTFVMEMEKVTFPEALRMLAGKAGIRMAAPDPRERAAADEREEILRINRWAAGLFHKRLLEGEEGEEARAYVAKRAISPAMTSRFMLGYAPRSFDWLLEQGRLKGYSGEALEAAGLAVLKESRNTRYSRFRNRLIFPIFDVRDRVVGFGARALDPADEPKYLNSPETPVFRKKEVLYGLNFARQAAGKAGRLAIVEGYTDVIAAHQHGHEYAVATLGTALASEHVKQLRRFAPKVVAVYDGDAAGRKASERSLDFFLNEEVEFRIASLPPGLDPADCFVQMGPEPFERAVKEAKELFEFRVAMAREKHDVKTAKGASDAVNEIIAMVAQVDNEVLREAQVRRVAEAFRVPESAVHRELRRLGARAAGAGVGRGGATGAEAPPETRSADPPEAVRAGREIVELLLLGDDVLRKVRERVPLEQYPTLESRKLGELILGVYDEKGTASRDAVFAAVAHDAGLSARLADLVEEGRRKQGNADNRIEGISGYLEARRHRAEESRIEGEISAARSRGDEEGERAGLEALRRIRGQGRTGGGRRSW